MDGAVQGESDENGPGAGAAGRVPACLRAGGEMGRLMREHDWSTTLLGSPEYWPQCLQSALGICLEARFALLIWWGEQLVLLYNDAYSLILGDKHPRSLGTPGSEVWSDVWPVVGPMLRRVVEQGESIQASDLFLVMNRYGYDEETYFSFSYSPIYDEQGRVRGVFTPVIETTDKVIGARRSHTLRELLPLATEDDAAACAALAQVLAQNPYDLPFAAFYLLDEAGDTATLAAAAGIAANHPAFPASQVLRAEPAAGGPVWPFAAAVERCESVFIADLRLVYQGELPHGAWPVPPQSAMLLPIGLPGRHRPHALLLVGLSPRRRLDESYCDFLELVAARIAQALGETDARREACRRAEMLAELDQAKTTFFTNISHEFRTPLTLMLGPIETLLNDPALTSPTQRSLLELVQHNSRRLLKLVNTLLDFAAIEADRLEAVPVPLDLAAFTSQLAATFRPTLEAAGLQFRVDCPSLGCPVAVDRDMWEKIVLNLLSNAFKFTFEGEITLTLAASPDGKSVQLRVSDTGVGIEPAMMARLFERFHRSTSSHGRSSEGSGIGLSLVRELARLHGGEVEVDSTPGQGSCFIVTLPFEQSGRPDELVQPSVRASDYAEEAKRWLPDRLPAFGAVADAFAPYGRIVLADDNADMRAYVCQLLSGEGYAVESYEDGASVLAALQRAPADLVLADVMMPHGDGFELLQAIRSDPALRDTAVILLSARAGNESRLEGFSAGADDYLVKPFDGRELAIRVTAAVRMARLRRQTNLALREEAHALERLNQIGTVVAAEPDTARALQLVTDAATELAGAAFGAFFHNNSDEPGGGYRLYTLSGAASAAFHGLPMPRRTPLFAPTFDGSTVVRSDDITADLRYGRNPPHLGLPPGHPLVRSYLAAPVISRSGEVLGGLFLGHPSPARFNARDERLVVGIAAQAASVLDKAKLYQAAQQELAERRRMELALREREEELQRLNETLEARVKARTQELGHAYQQLLAQIDEKKQVEATLHQMQRLEAVGQLTAGVAHDFNNLLTVVLGNLSPLARVLNEPALKRRIDMIRVAAERGAMLTSQLLAFSRRQRLDPKAINLNYTVIGLRDLLQSSMGGNIEIEMRLDPGLWAALVDPTQIELVILNLSLNARDAMKNGGRLAISTNNVVLQAPTRPGEPEAGEYVRLSVSDNGSGMSEEVLAKAFDPFFTTKEVGKGSGLGLAQVYGFAKQSRGGVHIDTKLGIGTSVEVLLPRAETGDQTLSLQAEPHVRRQERSVATILLVDDDPAVREVTALMLRDLGYGVVEAGSGVTALDLLERRQDIDLVLADFAMPGMHGVELSRRARERRPDFPFVFVTGYFDLDALADLGDDLVVQKPFRDQELAEKIEQTLARHAGKDAEAVPDPVRRGLTVLYVENSRAMREPVCEYLDELGHQVIALASAEEALAVLDQQPFDVLFTDVRLPGMPGTELARIVVNRFPGKPIVLASGYGRQIDIRQLGDRVEFLPKPFDLELLEAMLNKVAGMVAADANPP
ncbi:response regulator [Chitinimonas lacunae]|uniref:histidine kinase n=1 Tax=Chitinimonas lacunae TaxID=1963018 RepID=A0ABV8MM33_9NEIS